MKYIFCKTYFLKYKKLGQKKKRDLRKIKNKYVIIFNHLFYKTSLIVLIMTLNLIKMKGNHEEDSLEPK